MAEFNSRVDFSFAASADFPNALAKLGTLGPRIQDAVSDTIRDELQDLTEQAKAKLMGQTVHGLKQTGLRARIAAGIEVVKIEGGHQAQVQVPETDMLPIPWGLDTASKGWKHPVFGHDPWVHQSGSSPWWSETMAQAAPDLEAKLPEAIDQVVDETFGR